MSLPVVFRTLIDGVELRIPVQEVSYRKKMNAGTTFSVIYPDEEGMVRGMFREFKSIVRVEFYGGAVLEGMVTGLSGVGSVTVACADPFTQLSKENLTAADAAGYEWWDCAAVLYDIFANLSGQVFLSGIGHTSPEVLYPADLITKSITKKNAVDKILKYINKKTFEEGVNSEQYFFNYIDGILTLEKLETVSNAEAILEVSVDKANLFGSHPQYHFDRLVNHAQGFGAEGLEGPVVEDSHSTDIYGKKYPSAPMTSETDSIHELYLAAIQTVEAKKDTYVTGSIELPHGHGITPGLHVIDVQDPANGLVGNARVVQVQGGVGNGKKVKVDLDTVPADTVETILAMVRAEDA